MPESFVFYESYLKGIELQDEQVQNKLFLAICRYALRGEQPQDLSRSELGIFELMRPTIDSNTQRRENGLKGGRPKKEESTKDEQQEKPVVSQKEKKQKPMVSSESEKEKPNENENESEKENEKENGYGYERENEKDNEDYSEVELSSEEKDELVKMSDSLSVQSYIKKLSSWQQENHRRSSKAYTVIKNWIMEDTIKQAKRYGNFPTQNDDYDQERVDKLTAIADSFLEHNKHMINNL